jgi:hypothetical protein
LQYHTFGYKKTTNVTAFAILFYLLFVVYFMAVLKNFGRFFPANLLAGTLFVLLQLKHTFFTRILTNIKQSQNPVLIRKTKKKERKNNKIFLKTLKSK